MNILIPHTWLLEHLDTAATPEQIQEYVSLCGPSIERIYDREGEKVYDIEVTTNRVDSMSVRGIAREMAVILTQFGIKAKLKPMPTTTLAPATQAEKSAPAKTATKLPLPVIASDPKLCRRVVCVVLSNIQRTATPDWMAKRLLQIDQHVHDSVIDITNYITHEIGHPVHAFDYDALMAVGQGHILIKQAKKGKKFVTLDGAEFTTVGGEVVFENPSGEIIDLPAIKGTANTSISDSTRNVLLWIENLEPILVRFASMTHAIRTVAAQLSEKNVDPHSAEPTLQRGIQLYQQLCGAQLASPIHDEFPGKRSLKPVVVKLDRITEYLGVEIPLKTITTILEQLECEVELKKGALHVSPPTFRPDLTIPADIIEEIARMYGYHKLDSVLMDTRIPQIKPDDVNFDLENRIKHFLAAVGWQEVYTYSMVSEALALESGHQLTDHLKLANPLSDDRVYLRRSLVPSLTEVILANPLRTQLSVFEIAHVYKPVTADLPEQKLLLTLVSSQPYRSAKGDLERLLAQFFITQLRVQPMAAPAPGMSQSAILMSGSTELGIVGLTSAGQSVFELPVEQLLTVAQTHPAYQAIAKSPAVLEDLTFTLPETVLVGDVLASIAAVSPHIDQVTLKDLYKRNATFSLQYLDRAADASLTAEAVERLRKQVVNLVQTQYRGTLVGALQ